MKCPLCGGINANLLAEITKRPEVEIDYSIPENLYLRNVYQCQDCSVYFNAHSLIDFTTFYEGHYNHSIDPMHAIDSRFNRIINIPFELSDNKHRVKRVVDKLKNTFLTNTTPKVLDVGSGTSVFLFELLKNWAIDPYCIDPDENSIAHVRKNIPQINGQVGTLSDLSTKTKFDLITFNKVLEHVPDPIDQLKLSKKLLTPSGVVYVELPFGDIIAATNSFAKHAEFNVEHITIYNIKSIEYLANHSGFIPSEVATIVDPSGKQTIYAFLTNK